MSQHQTVKQRKALKRRATPTEVVNNVLRQKAWDKHRMDFSFTRLLLILAVMGTMVLTAALTPFRDNMISYLSNGHIVEWWSVAGYVGIIAVTFIGFIWVDNKITTIVRKRIENTYESLKKEYWDHFEKELDGN